MADHVAWGDKSPGCSLPAAWLYRLVTLQNFPSLCILYRDIEWEMPPTPPPRTLGPELGWCLGMIGTFKRWIFVGESTSLGVPFCIYSLIPLSRLLPDSSLCIISTVKGVICWLSQFLAPGAGCHATPPWQTCPLEPYAKIHFFFQKSFWLHVLSQQHKVTQTDVFQRDVPIRKHSKVKEEPTEVITSLSASFSTAISLLTCISPSLAQCKQRGKLHTFPSLRRVRMVGAPLPCSASWWTKAFSSRPSRHLSHYALTPLREWHSSFSFTFPYLRFQFLYFSVGYLELIIWNLSGNGIFIEYFQHCVFLRRRFLWSSHEVKNMPPCDLPTVHCMIHTLHGSLAFFQSFWHRSAGSLCGGTCPSSSWMAGTGFFILWVTAGSEGRRKHSWPLAIPRFVCLLFFVMLPQPLLCSSSAHHWLLRNASQSPFFSFLWYTST